MPQRTGTYDISALLATKTTVGQEISLDAVAETLTRDNANFSEQVTGALSEFCETSTDVLRAVGGSVGGDMMEVDEYGQGPTQRDVPGGVLGFPLRKFQFPVGWTKQWEKNASPADFAIKNGAAQGASLRRLRYELQRAIFVPTNYTFRDHLVNNADIPVKAFVNADGMGIPNGPNGEVFDGSTHTHYDGSATLTAAAAQAQINDILEHRNGAKIRIYINAADVTMWEALTGFVKLELPHLTLATNRDRVESPRMAIQLDNRQIGWFGAAEVWTKPWAIANYSVAVDIDAPQKPLVRRVERNDRGLHIAAEVDVHPLRAQYIEQFYGFGAHNRVAVHVLKYNNATYSAPTLSY